MKKRLTVRGGPVESVLALSRVAELKSFRAAAGELGVSVSAVSQTVRALEQRAGVALLSRTTRSVALTEAGHRFLERARPAAEQLRDAFDATRSYGKRITGLLRLNVPRATIPGLIEPIVFDFCALYPDVQVEVFAQDTNADIIAEGFDAGMRLGDAVATDMVALRLTHAFRFSVVGSPLYFQRNGKPERPRDLARHRCICSRKRASDSVRSWTFQENGRACKITVDGPMIVNDLQLNLAAARRGLGLAYTPRPLAEPYLALAELESVLDEFCPQTPGVFLYYPHRKQALPKLRAFIDFVRRYTKSSHHERLRAL